MSAEPSRRIDSLTGNHRHHCNNNNNNNNNNLVTPWQALDLAILINHNAAHLVWHTYPTVSLQLLQLSITEPRPCHSKTTPTELPTTTWIRINIAEA